jgi:hypothetical protein
MAAQAKKKFNAGSKSKVANKYSNLNKYVKYREKEIGCAFVSYLILADGLVVIDSNPW